MDQERDSIPSLDTGFFLLLKLTLAYIAQNFWRRKTVSVLETKSFFALKLTLHQTVS